MKCFVIGPIGDSDTQIRADADDFMKYIVAPVVSEIGYEAPIRADNMNEPGRITSQIIRLLMDAELVIADLTLNNPNVYYELCLRHALGKPVIHMATLGTTLPFDVRDNRTIFYTLHSRDAEVAREELKRQISHIGQPDYRPMNPILETISIVSLERSADPTQKALGQLMSMVEGLGGDVQELQRTVQGIQLRMPVGYVSPQRPSPVNLQAVGIAAGITGGHGSGGVGATLPSAGVNGPTGPVGPTGHSDLSGRAP